MSYAVVALDQPAGAVHDMPALSYASTTTSSVSPATGLPGFVNTIVVPAAFVAVNDAVTAPPLMSRITPSR